MLFNSYVFVLYFLPVTLLGYYGLNRFGGARLANIWLALASLFFYGYFNWAYLPLILCSIGFNFLIGRCVNTNAWGSSLSQPARKALLALGILANVGSLFVFKYYDFFTGNINLLFGTHLRLLHLLLPLGISFFTFQQISYIVDNASSPPIPVYSFDTYALYVSFFPQLIAGPIVLHSEMVPQFMDPERRHFDRDNFAKGLMAFSFGLAKKVLLADSLATMVDAGFGSLYELGTVNALIVMLSYTLQIYFDFSGYCDMATGIGLFFNIDIPMNFNSPYRALTISEFWDRWHMTLTRFFTKYLYIDLLGGNRKGRARTYLNMLIVFLVSGLWHGANWTFVLWGAMHGVACVLNRMFRRSIDKWHPAFSWFCTFAFVNAAWVVFRSDSIGQAVELFRQLLSFDMLSPSLLFSAFSPKGIFEILDLFSLKDLLYKLSALYLAFGLFAVLQLKNTNERLADFRPSAGVALVSSAFFVLSLLSFTGVSVFLYWNF